MGAWEFREARNLGFCAAFLVNIAHLYAFFLRSNAIKRKLDTLHAPLSRKTKSKGLSRKTKKCDIGGPSHKKMEKKGSQLS